MYQKKAYELGFMNLISEIIFDLFFDPEIGSQNLGSYKTLWGNLGYMGSGVIQKSGSSGKW